MGSSSNKGFLWGLSHSLWVLWTFLFMPCVGFFIIGKRAGHRPWLIWGGIYLVCMLIVFTFIDSEYKDSKLFEAFLVLYFLGSFVHTFVARSEYLRKLRAIEDGEDLYEEQRHQGGVGYANRAEQFASQYNARHNRQTVETGRSDTQSGSTATERPDHTAVKSQARQARQAAAMAASTATASAASAAVVDVNSCSLTELSALPGIGIVEAKQAVKYRFEHGGFASFDEFATVVKLKPHFLVQLQDRVVCGPVKSTPEAGAPSQPEDTPTTEHHGRSLDL